MVRNATERFTVKIDGEERPELSDLSAGVTLEVTHEDGLAATCGLVVPLAQAIDGTWSLLDDDRLQVGKPIAIQAGFGDAPEDLFTGYITQILPQLPSDPRDCRLEIWALDDSVRLDREDKLKGWPDRKDSEIAKDIFESYGLKAEVGDTEVSHNSKISTTMQRETDMQFLRRLARRNGFECYIAGDTGYFRAPARHGDPQPALAAHARDATNLIDISFEVNALAPANVTMTQIDPTTRETLEVVVETSERRALGARGSAAILQGGVPAARIHVAHSVSTGVPEMTALCQSLFQRGEWFVTATGEVASGAYGHVLTPRATVTIKGVGETYSGTYYVNRVCHRFSASGYTQQFRAVRNGLGLTGAEDFGGGSGGLP